MVDDITAHMDKSYDLIYVDYRDTISDAELFEIIEQGEYLDHVDRWYEEQRDTYLDEIIRGLLMLHRVRHASPEQLEEGFDEDDDDDLEVSSDVREALIEAVCERDTSDPLDQLLRNTGNVLWRYRINFGDTDDPIHFLTSVGLPLSLHNISVARVVLTCDESNEEAFVIWYGDCRGPVMSALNQAWGNDEAPDTITFTNPELVFLDGGSGDTARFEGTITLPFDRDNLTPDKGSPICGWDEIADVCKPYYDNKATFAKVDVKENIIHLSARLSRCV